MLDQSFSAENFRKILELENRKGTYLEGEFYPEIEELSKNIKRINFEIRLLNVRQLQAEDYEAEREKLNKEKKQLKEEKEKRLLDKLKVVSSNVTSESFKLAIQIDTSITAKPVYRTSRSLENILALKQLQYNFRKLYKVKQANRFSIVSQLKNLLDDGFPKVVLKTDIKDFYESIPHTKLLEKISDENLLTYLSQRFIQQILSGYKSIPPSKTKGVPRGIGISPYLVELYMRDIDSEIKRLPGVMYYSRYVDDIVVVFMPNDDNAIRDYKSEVKTILEQNNLAMNEEPGKTNVLDLLEKGKNHKYKIEYLGYSFASGYKRGRHIPLTITISKRKKEKYKKRLFNALKIYKAQSKGNEKRARKLFVKRIRFLMTNTRLSNNKRNVLTGVFFSNSLITTVTDLRRLDTYFRTMAIKLGLPPRLINRVTSKYSFVSGFNRSCLSKFNASDLTEIMRNW